MFADGAADGQSRPKTEVATRAAIRPLFDPHATFSFVSGEQSPNKGHERFRTVGFQQIKDFCGREAACAENQAITMSRQWRARQDETGHSYVFCFPVIL